MKKRILAMAIALLAVVGTIMVEAALSGHGKRYIEHQMRPSVTEPAQDVINSTALSKTQYDPNAVDIEKLITHLPLLEINTQDEEIPGQPYYATAERDNTVYTLSKNGESTIVAELQVRDSKDGLNSIADEPSLKSAIRIRVRGNSSRWFNKQSYAIRTVEEDGVTESGLPLLGMEPGTDWALHGPFLDKSLLRNYLGMNIAGQIMDYAPDVRFCEVVLNGEYRGLYVLMETVSHGEGRVDIQGIQEEKGITGYVIQFDTNDILSPQALDNFSLYSRILKQKAQIVVEYPGAYSLDERLMRYVERDVSAMEKTLYSYDYNSLDYGYSTFLDVDEFINYMLIFEIMEIHDAGNLSTFYYRDINSPVKPVVWDFNNSLDNYSIIAEDDFSIRKFVTVQAPWFLMLLKDQSFVDGVISKYRLLRDTVLSDEYLNAFIDDAVAYLGPAVDRNFAVWGYSFDSQNMDNHNKLHPDERNISSYEEAVSQLKGTLLDRLHWLDENIVVLNQYSHESAVKKYNP